MTWAVPLHFALADDFQYYTHCWEWTCSTYHPCVVHIIITWHLGSFMTFGGHFNSLSASLLLNIFLSFEVLALLTQLPTSNERKIPPHLKIKLAEFHNWGFTQDLYMHICSISVKF